MGLRAPLAREADGLAREADGLARFRFLFRTVCTLACAGDVDNARRSRSGPGAADRARPSLFTTIHSLQTEA